MRDKGKNQDYELFRERRKRVRQDEREWRRYGTELQFLRLLTLKILVNVDNQALVTKKESGHLNAAVDKIDYCRSQSEDKMFKELPVKADTDVFYGARLKKYDQILTDVFELIHNPKYNIEQ